MNTYRIQSYEDVRDSLRVRLMDIKRNPETLQSSVYEPVGCGLALVTYMELPEEIADGGIANVPAKLASGLADANPEAILEDAMERSVSQSHPKLCAIQGMLFGSMTGMEPENYLTGGDAPEDTLLVLTTEDGRLGASALFYPGMKEKIGEIVGKDYFVLPSSIHEVLIMPDNGQMTPMELAKMVKEINDNEVSPQDLLCSRVCGSARIRRNCLWRLTRSAAEKWRDDYGSKDKPRDPKLYGIHVFWTVTQAVLFFYSSYGRRRAALLPSEAVCRNRNGLLDVCSRCRAFRGAGLHHISRDDRRAVHLGMAPLRDAGAQRAALRV